MYVNMTYCLPYFVPPCSLSPPLPKAHLLGWIGDAYGPFIPSILLSTLSIRVVLFDPNWVPTYCNQFTVFLLTSWAAWGTLSLRVTPWPLSFPLLIHQQNTSASYSVYTENLTFVSLCHYLPGPGCDHWWWKLSWQTPKHKAAFPSTTVWMCPFHASVEILTPRWWL